MAGIQPSVRLPTSSSNSPTGPFALSSPAVPRFSDIKFSNIGQQPDLLKRISAPDPDFSYQEQPSSLPDWPQQVLPSVNQTSQNEAQVSRTRLSLLEALADPADTDNSGHDVHMMGASDTPTGSPIVDIGASSQVRGTKSHLVAPNSQQKSPPLVDIRISKDPGMNRVSGSSTDLTGHSSKIGPFQRNLSSGAFTTNTDDAMMPVPSYRPSQLSSVTTQRILGNSSQVPTQSSVQTDSILTSEEGEKYAIARALHSRIASSLASFYPPDLLKVLNCAQAVKMQIDDARSFAHNARNLADASLNSAQQSLAAAQACAASATEASVRAYEIRDVIEKLKLGDPENGGWLSQGTMAALEHDLKALGEWVREREMEETTRRRAEQIARERATEEARKRENEQARQRDQEQLRWRDEENEEQAQQVRRESENMGTAIPRRTPELQPQPPEATPRPIQSLAQRLMVTGKNLPFEESPITARMKARNARVNVDAIEDPTASPELAADAVARAWSQPGSSTNLRFTAEEESRRMRERERIIEKERHVAQAEADARQAELDTLRSQRLKMEEEEQARQEQERVEKERQLKEKLEKELAIQAERYRQLKQKELEEQAEKERLAGEARRQTELLEKQRKETEAAAARDRAQKEDQDRKRQQVMIEKQKAAADDAARINAERAKGGQPATPQLPIFAGQSAVAPSTNGISSLEVENLTAQAALVPASPKSSKKREAKLASTSSPITTAFPNTQTPQDFYRQSSNGNDTQPIIASNLGQALVTETPARPTVPSGVPLNSREQARNLSTLTDQNNFAPINLPQVIHIPECQPGVYPQTPRNKSQPLSVHRGGKDVGNIPVVPLYHSPPVSSETKTYNRRYVLNQSSTSFDKKLLKDDDVKNEPMTPKFSSPFGLSNAPTKFKKTKPLQGVQGLKPVKDESPPTVPLLTLPTPPPTVESDPAAQEPVPARIQIQMPNLKKHIDTNNVLGTPNVPLANRITANSSSFAAPNPAGSLDTEHGPAVAPASPRIGPDLIAGNGWGLSDTVRDEEDMILETPESAPVWGGHRVDHYSPSQRGTPASDSSYPHYHNYSPASPRSRDLTPEVYKHSLSPAGAGHKRYRDEHSSSPPPARRYKHDDEVWRNPRDRGSRGGNSRRSTPPTPPGRHRGRGRGSTLEDRPLSSRLGPDVHKVGRGESYRPSYSGDSRYAPTQPRRTSGYAPLKPQYQASSRQRSPSDSQPGLLSRFSDSTAIPTGPGHSGRGGGRGRGKPRGGGRGGAASSLEDRISSNLTLMNRLESPSGDYH